ncbi:universal stress protein [Natronomonas gomsonensis]|uniref:universal stress protein n=1 Tax=Natronomonas gomsonensis TaxID=1046043 RepID=UPI0020CA9991|nr:universal stress protein [Natronomonas gomsonensis]MCY4732772.1 universal stress protein [Natronomonas gomsonensis]
MTYLAAFDGTDRSETALRRAAEFAGSTDERLVVVSVLPNDEDLAAEYGLVEGDTYDPGDAARRLRKRVESITTDAEFRTESVDAYAGKGRIATEIREAARELDADVVFVGSDNAGRVVQPVTSVGGAVASGTDYDVFIVRS